MADTSLVFNILGRDGVSRVFRNIRSEANDTADTFGRITKSGVGMESLIPIVGRLGGSFGALANPVGIASLAVGGLVLGMAGAAAAAAGVGVAAVGAFAGLGGFALRENEQVKTAFTNMKNHVSAELTRLAQPLVPTFVGIADTISRTFDAVAPSIGRSFEAVGPMIEKLVLAFSDLAIKVMPALVDVMEAASPVIDAIAEGIRGPLADGIVGFLNNVKDAMPAAAQFMRDFFTVAGPIIEFIGWLIKDLAQAYLEFRADVISVIDSVSAAWSSFVGFLSGVWAAITGAVSSAWSFITGVVNDAVNRVRGIINWFGQLPGMIRNWFQGAANGARDALNGMIGFVAGIPGRILGAIGNLGGLLVAAGRSLIDGLARGIRSAIGAAVSAAQSAVSAVRRFFPFSPAKEGPFSGRGYTTFSGQALITDFGKSIMRSAPVAAQAASRAVGQVHAAVGTGTVQPARAGSGAQVTGGTVTLEINSGGSRMDDVMVELLRKAVRVRGGNVQAVLGS